MSEGALVDGDEILAQFRETPTTVDDDLQQNDDDDDVDVLDPPCKISRSQVVLALETLNKCPFFETEAVVSESTKEVLPR